MAVLAGQIYIDVFQDIYIYICVQLFADKSHGANILHSKPPFGISSRKGAPWDPLRRKADQTSIVQGNPGFEYINIIYIYIIIYIYKHNYILYLILYIYIKYILYVIYLSSYIYVSIFVYLPIYLPIYLPTYLSIYLSFYSM